MSDHPDWREMARDYDEREAAAGSHGRIDITEHVHCLDSECGAAWLIRREDHWRQRVIEAEAAAGPRDEGGFPGWHRALGEAAAGPPDRGEPINAEAFHRWQAEAQAAAGPRDEGLDVERLAEAMFNVGPEDDYDVFAQDVAREYAALAKASE